MCSGYVVLLIFLVYFQRTEKKVINAKSFCLLKNNGFYLLFYFHEPVFRYVFLLAEYETNSVELNRAILKMLHRIAFDLNSCSRLFQVYCFFRIYKFFILVLLLITLV